MDLDEILNRVHKNALLRERAARQHAMGSPQAGYFVEAGIERAGRVRFRPSVSGGGAPDTDGRPGFTPAR
ncbi:hypothetical protein [Microbispora rosea]|uniref:hypothetical protein n=1 Tax=Microbispora rosea TaxID=58117 RepID=UPI00344979F3